MSTAKAPAAPSGRICEKQWIMHLKIDKEGGFPKITSFLFIVDHCQTLLGKSGYKQETNVCTTPYNSFV